MLDCQKSNFELTEGFRSILFLHVNLKVLKSTWKYVSCCTMCRAHACARCHGSFKTLRNSNYKFWASQMQRILSPGYHDLTQSVQPVSSVITSSLVGVRDNTSQLLSRNMKAGLPRSRICSQNIIHKSASLLFFPSSYLGGCDITFRRETTILVLMHFLKILLP